MRVLLTFDSFPRPKIFTNALLQPHHITALIRDTELHERALFSVPPPQDTASSRRTTTFQSNGASLLSGPAAVRAPRRNTAVAAVLGGDMLERIRRGGGGPVGTGSKPQESKEKGEVDVDLLLEGAEKLCAVYPIPDASDRIASLRQRYQRLAASIDHYEREVAEQAEQLNKMNRPRDFGADDDEDQTAQLQPAEEVVFTEQDMRREEEEVKELEQKKRTLEERVSAMEKDISGVLG